MTIDSVNGRINVVGIGLGPILFTIDLNTTPDGLPLLLPSGRLGGGSAMAACDGGTTDPGLIGRVGDWDDSSAWRAFDATYRPVLRGWAWRLGAAGDDADELAQRVLVEATQRLKGFRYDPSKTFRGWLWRLVQCRALDMVRARRSAELPLLDGDVEPEARPAPGLDLARTTVAPDSQRLRLTDEIQQAVRARVSPESWQVFWMVQVEGYSVTEAASALGKSYAAAYRNHQRVVKMLREEADRRLGPGPVDGC
jgi:RNA polymerase sigma-70 factor (ECF subfamily)